MKRKELCTGQIYRQRKFEQQSSRDFLRNSRGGALLLDSIFSTKKVNVESLRSECVVTAEVLSLLPTLGFHKEHIESGRVLNKEHHEGEDEGY